MLSSSLQLSDNNGDGDPHLEYDRNTKKVRLKDSVVDEDTTMTRDPESQPVLSWKDKLLRGKSSESALDRSAPNVGCENDFELLKGDVNTTLIDGVSTITFSDRIKEILFREMELTVVVKLLGRNIGYNALYNRIMFLWKPNVEDYNRDLTQDPWVVYGQYLTVQPWTRHFSPSQPYPSVVLAWIHLPNLSGYLYKQKIIEAIGGLIGKVVKLDVQTDNQTRGRFACLDVYINLENSLIFQMIVDGAVQRVEYEALSMVCFAYGKYDHVKETCLSVAVEQNLTGPCGKPVAEMATLNEGRSDDKPIVSKNGEKEPSFGLWMLVERKTSRRGKKEISAENKMKQTKQQ
ncbi:hypothetical protein J1N35_000300 [Gossypium stocksii]|uniref:DUF4283 domain-containing protein n=1 Tax=Gossypium stocksii TaxID=47602 RepID=A0A9D3WFG3_9ROSI|nr:hypothetical protein J1N35_000300 [Gossypium stocksii]